MIFCKDCKFIPNYDNWIEKKFIAVNPEDAPKDWRGDTETHTYHPACQHEVCFVRGQKITPFEIVKTKERVKGQAQLNGNNDCKYFVHKDADKIKKQQEDSRLTPKAQEIANREVGTPWYKFW